MKVYLTDSEITTRYGYQLGSNLEVADNVQVDEKEIIKLFQATVTFKTASNQISEIDQRPYRGCGTAEGDAAQKEVERLTKITIAATQVVIEMKNKGYVLRKVEQKQL